MIFFLDACTDSGFLSVIYFIKKMIDIVFLILPIILIVMISVDLAKNVMAKGADDMKKNTNIAIKRIIYCVCAFLIPTIVNLVINTVYDLTSNNGTKENALLCWKNATKDNIQTYREIEEAERKAKEEKDKQEANDKHNQNQQNMDKDKPSGGLGGKTDEDGDGNGSSSGGDSGGGTTTVSNYTLYVGDSRTVGMCKVVTLSSNEECKAEESQGHTWLTGVAVHKIKSVLSDHPDANIVINLGTNDVGNVSSYASYYKQLSTDNPNAKIIAISLTPVDDNKAKANGYSIRNADINSFNKSLQDKLSGSNVKYCDVNSKLTGSLYSNRGDGVHHNGDTYRKIYELIKECL